MEIIINFITKTKKLMGCGVSNQNASQQVDIPVRDLYKKEQLIGVGNHGSVYRGVHQLNHTVKAIKVINQMPYLDKSVFSPLNYPSTIQKFKQLKHPKIMDYEYAELGGRQLSIVMEIAKDGTLHKYVKKNGKCSEEWISGIVRQILEGLLFLHSKGVLHKDLKSNNILMLGDDNIKITDYGLAQLYDQRLIEGHSKRNNQCEFTRGYSFPYMAPEVILGHGGNEKADVWSVGCITVEMLTGKVPWQSMSPTFQESFHKIRTSACPPFPAQISKECEDFLKGCLSVSQGRRKEVKQLIMHPFVNKGNNPSELYFEVSNDSTLKPENDKSNRTPINSDEITRKQNLSSREIRKEKGSSKDTKGKGERRYNNENYIEIDSSHISKTSKNIKQEQKGNFEPSRSSLRSQFPHEFSTISKEDILPQINEDQQETNMVMLNNKKVKLKSPPFKKHHVSQSSHMKTEPSNDREYRNSINLEQSGLNDSRQEVRGLGKKIDTEPSLLISDFESSKDYFKKPLKLLKKKIQQNKKRSKMNNASDTFTNQSYSKVDTDRYNENKIRTETERSREEVVINTEYARAQRDRYINQQLHMRKQREQEKLKWEEQLKKEAKHMRNQFARRYAYPMLHDMK